jgi:serine/threonine-protein kinase
VRRQAAALRINERRRVIIFPRMPTDFLSEYADKPLDGKYRIIERLGAGGMGEVFKVEHTYLGAIRVVKIIRAQIASSSDAHDRFLREARVATKIQHPNVATLHDFSALPDGSHYMVWEFIDGENLAQVLKRRGTLPARHAVRITMEALAGLDAIHRAGIVHRDISPENIMITRDNDGEERVKIIDLGVAKSSDADTMGMTQTGMFVGKFRYSSPEHVGFMNSGEKIDGRADLYSLAIVLYEMLTGRPPFEATSPHEYILHHSRDEYLHSHDLDRVGGTELQGVLAKALDRDRNRRFATAREFAEALARIVPALPDEASATMIVPVDGDSTTRLSSAARQTLGTTPPQPTTVRTNSPAGPMPTMQSASPFVTPPTVRANIPASPPTVAVPVGASQTVIDPVPMPPQRRRSVLVPLLIVFVLLGLLGVAAVVAFLHFRGNAATPVAATSAPAPAGRPSQTTIDVAQPPATTSSATAPATVSELSSTSATATTATAAPQPATATVASQPRRRQERVEQPATPQPAPAEAEPEAAPAPTPAPASSAMYREGGDGGANDAALASLRQQLSGTSRVYVTGGDAEMLKQLTDALRGKGVDIGGEDIPIAIRFTGSVDRGRLGRKHRSATATVRKNGRPIFEYKMPSEEYRVGDTPAEAFARIVLEAMGK